MQAPGGPHSGATCQLLRQLVLQLAQGQGPFAPRGRGPFPLNPGAGGGGLDPLGLHSCS
jgi:hypothetical protein